MVAPAGAEGSLELRVALNPKETSLLTQQALLLLRIRLIRVPDIMSIVASYINASQPTANDAFVSLDQRCLRTS